MMKKMLIFMLVLGLATSAKAELSGIELSVNGEYNGNGNVTEVTIAPCQEIVIDMAAPEGYDFTAYLIIEGDPPALGEWGDNLGEPYAGYNGGYFFDNQLYPILGDGAGEDSGINRYDYPGWGFGYEISDTQFSGVNPGGTVAEFLFHCVGEGDIAITLWDAGGDYITPEDTVIIHQVVPEPATIALLGLGGLLLRRRK